MEGDERGPSTLTSRYWIMVETTAMQVMLEGEKVLRRASNLSRFWVGTLMGCIVVLLA